jgi:polyphosphate kinase
LSFNERVLLKAYDKAIPFGERLRFVTISSENLDEFYMVRIAGLLLCKIKPEAKSLMDKEVERRLKNFANASNLNYEIV